MGLLLLHPAAAGGARLRPRARAAGSLSGTETVAAETEVAIVGGGLAGLVAARELRHAGIEVVVLEAGEEVGGRTGNATLGGLTIDRGGTFIGFDQDRTVALAGELGLTLTPTYNRGDNVIFWRGRRRRYAGTVPRLDPLTLLGIGRLRNRIDRMALTVPLGSPWEAPAARHLDALTLDGWMRRGGFGLGARDLMRIATQVSWGCEPEEISMLHVLHYLHGTGGLDRMLAVEGGAQEVHLEEGAQTISHRLAAALGDDLILDAPVTEVDWGEDRATVWTRRGPLWARRVVLAMSPAMRARIRFSPHLPHPWSEVSQRWFQGPVSKVYALYDRPFWREDGLSGEAVADAGPVRVTLDAGAPDASHGLLLGFVAADCARAWDRLPAAERRAQALGSFAEMFGPEALEPSDYVDYRWAEEPWIGGGSVAAAPPFAWTACGRGIATPLASLHWAGTETAGRWTGFMEGAIRSGERVAREIAASLHTSLAAAA
ncbi:MAG: flavin monoamine oxidase family protein [Actinobacteria bacterium]|nr:flavin monoamine oxidase family protein [Actinomycetota bacterium]